MNALPPGFPPARDDEGIRQWDTHAGNESESAMAQRWTALEEAGAAVALLAGIGPDAAASRQPGLPEAFTRVQGWRREAMANGLEDLAAIMEPGLAALLAIKSRGSNASAPALALWREFDAARTALFALATAGSAMRRD